MSAEFGALSSPGGIFSLIREGRAQSRADLSRLTGLAPSTVALRVDRLIQAGYVTEAGEGDSRGGRRPRRLTVSHDDRLVAGIDMAIDSVTVGLYNLAGSPLHERRAPLDLAGSPHEVLSRVHTELMATLTEVEPEWQLTGIGLSVPGPVSAPEGQLVSPSRMPGWNGADPAEILGSIAHVPVRTENDANAMAWGEFVATERRHTDLILVTAGASIGSGIIADGRLYRGARGMAGDVSHTSVTDAPQVLCSCGRFGCLDVVAGGQAITQALRSAGVDAPSVASLATLTADGHPLATRLVRESGIRTGVVLATIVSFFNPERLVFTGPLAHSEAFTAGVRSSVYDLCLPLSTNGLQLTESGVGPTLGARGVAQLFLESTLTPAEVDAAVALL